MHVTWEIVCAERTFKDAMNKAIQYIGQRGINRGTYREIKDLNQDIMNTFCFSL